jgi:hypothetical protein
LVLDRLQANSLVLFLVLFTSECRQICAVLKEEVSKKFSSQTNAAVAGYLILRLINPAIATPDFFGIIAPTAMSTDIRRALILLSKMVQNIANNVDFKKEAYMTHFNDYVVTASPPFAEFLIASAVCEMTNLPCSFSSRLLMIIAIVYRLYRRI